MVHWCNSKNDVLSQLLWIHFRFNIQIGCFIFNIQTYYKYNLKTNATNVAPISAHNETVLIFGHFLPMPHALFCQWFDIMQRTDDGTVMEWITDRWVVSMFHACKDTIPSTPSKSCACNNGWTADHNRNYIVSIFTLAAYQARKV